MSYKDNYYWEHYYKTTSADNIPWERDFSRFFKNIFNQISIPSKGTILDVGCGLGEKSLYLAQLGYTVWGFDISEAAIEQAKIKASGMQNKPTFFVGNVLSLNTAKEIENIKFDLIIDKLVSQFFSTEEKQKYLNDLEKHIMPQHTILVLQTIGKENDTEIALLPEWKRKVAQTKDQVYDIYGKVFENSGRDKYISVNDVDTYIMKAV